VFGIDDVSLAPDGGDANAGAHYHYVIDHEFVPQTNADVTSDSLDLDNDGVVDNKIANALVVIAEMGFDTQGPTTYDIDHGTNVELVDVQTTDFTTASAATVQLLLGGSPVPAACNGSGDTTCRHHLDGNGAFSVDEAPDAAMAGSIAASTLLAGPGHATVKLSLVAGMPLTFHLIGARVKIVAPSATSFSPGTRAVIGGALAKTELDALYPQLAAMFDVLVARDCNPVTPPPTCGCTDGTEGKMLIGLFDTTHDCVITSDEIKNSTIIQPSLAPDVMVENQQATSFGMGFTAVKAGFTN
jgi:hypothetical protein